MAKCPKCGKSYPDDVVACSDCLETLESEFPSESEFSSPRKHKSGVVGFCLNVAFVVSCVNCFAVPVFGGIFFRAGIHESGGLGSLLILLLTLVALCVSIAQAAVFRKVSELYKKEL
jgi:hypothetical protein